MKTTLIFEGINKKEILKFKPELGAVINNNSYETTKKGHKQYIVSGFLYTYNDKANDFECDVFCTPVTHGDLFKARRQILQDVGYL